MLKYSDLIAGLKRGKLHPLYLFYGEEEFLIQEAVDLIINKALDPAARDFNLNTVYCRDTPASEIVTLCQTLPFMSEKRLVIAKELEAFKSAELDELGSYLNDPSPSTCLVMLSDEARYDKKSVLAAVEARGVVSRFFPLLDREITPWIEAWGRARGISIQRDAAQFLRQTLGNDLRKIDNELQKVLIYLEERKAVTVGDMKTVVGDFREYTSFDLAAALGAKNREKALLILSRLIQEGEAPVGLLGSVSWNFRRLMRAKVMEARGAEYEEIKKRLGVIFHQAASFQEQMRRFSLDELKDAFAVMLRTDKALKSSGLSGRLILERMILKLCGM